MLFFVYDFTYVLQSEVTFINLNIYYFNFCKRLSGSWLN